MRLFPISCGHSTLLPKCAEPVPVAHSDLAPYAAADLQPRDLSAFGEAVQEEEALVGAGLQSRFPAAAVQATLASMIPALGSMCGRAALSGGP